MMDQLMLRANALDVASELLNNVSVDDVLSVVDVSTDEAHEIINMLRDAEVTL